MSEVVAFIARLHQIAGTAASREECSARAFDLFSLYRTRLYARLGIGSSNRPTKRIKTEADRTLADLRQTVLRAEIAMSGSNAVIFTEVRHHIEMARRSLAIRIACDDASDDRNGLSERPASVHAALSKVRVRAVRREHRVLFEAARERSCDRRMAHQGQKAIGRSRNLLGRWQ